MTSERSAPSGSDRPTNRRLVLLTCCLSLFIVGIDVSGLNLALPSIRASLAASPSQLQWIMDSYTIVIASLLLMAGSLADRVGRRRVFRIGLVLFGAGSVLCAFAASAPFLVAARAVQAIGGPMLNPVAMSIITNTFTQPRERARAIGLWGVANGSSTAIGPLLGGILVETVGWRAIFWMNVPVVLVALTLATRYVPESRADRPRPVDLAGQVLVMAGLGALTYGIIEGREAGWTSPTVLGCGAVFGLCLVALRVVEGRAIAPLVDPRFFASWPFSGAVLSAVLGFMAMAGFLFVNTLYLQAARGYSPVTAGLLVLPMALCTGLLAPVSGHLVGTRGPRAPLVLAGLCTAAAALVLTRLTPDTSVVVLVLTYALFGMGQGLLNAPITNTAVSGMPRAQAGVASGIASVSRQVGSALGVAIFGTLTFGAMSSSTSSLARASHASWWLMLGCGTALTLIGVAVTTPAAEASSRRVARLTEQESS